MESSHYQPARGLCPWILASTQALSVATDVAPSTPIPQPPRQIRSPRGGADEHREPVGASNHLGISSLSPPIPTSDTTPNPSPGPLGRCPLAGGGAVRIPHRSPYPRTTSIDVTSRMEPAASAPATLRRPSGGVHLQPPDSSGGEGPRRLPPSMTLIAPSTMVANPPAVQPQAVGDLVAESPEVGVPSPSSQGCLTADAGSAGSCTPRLDPSPVVVLSPSAEPPGAFDDLRDDPVPSMTSEMTRCLR